MPIILIITKRLLSGSKVKSVCPGNLITSHVHVNIFLSQQFLTSFFKDIVWTQDTDTDRQRVPKQYPTLLVCIVWYCNCSEQKCLWHVLIQIGWQFPHSIEILHLSSQVLWKYNDDGTAAPNKTKAGTMCHVWLSCEHICVFFHYNMIFLILYDIWV